jgi:membrane protease YdiL (CAAX protease family)
MLDTPYWYRVAVVTRAAFVEELLVRGYGIERLQELTGSKVIAGARCSSSP